MKTLPLPPLELLQELFEVDATSPSGLRWKNPRSKRCKPGEIAGNCGHKEGRWRVSIRTDKDREYLTYRVVYYMTTGLDPLNLNIDHKNGNIKDNLNIRIATHSQNGGNSRPRAHHKGKPTSSKYKGVIWNKRAEKWSARITVKYRCIFLGYFHVETEAAQAYDSAAIKNFGQFALTNHVLFPDDGL